MLDINCLKLENVIHITPHDALEKKDFETLNDVLAAYINANDKVPALLIHAHNNPDWEHFSDLWAHVKFVRQAQRYVPKVAFVSDKKLVKTLLHMAKFFVKAKVRQFPEAHFDDALVWASQTGDHPGQYRLMDGFPNDVIAIEAEGVITAQDYVDMLGPLAAEKRKRHDKLKMLIVLDEDFQSFSGGAMWEDTKFGLHYLTKLSKLALVTDIGWMRNAVKVFGPLMPAKVRVFHRQDLESASEWIKT